MLVWLLQNQKQVKIERLAATLPLSFICLGRRIVRRKQFFYVVHYTYNSMLDCQIKTNLSSSSNKGSPKFINRREGISSKTLG